MNEPAFYPRGSCVPARLVLLALSLLAGCRSTGVGDGPAEPSSERALADPHRIVLRGNETFSEDVLRAAYADVSERVRRRGPSKAAVDDAAYLIAGFYRDEGFPQVNVTYEYLENPGEAFGEIEIREGPRCEIESFELTGNSAFSDDLLLRFFTLTREQLLGEEQAYYVDSRLRSELQQLRAYYYESGFLHVSVDGPDVEISEDGREAKVRVSVDEGPTFRIVAIEPSGELVGQEEEVRAILLRYRAEGARASDDPGAKTEGEVRQRVYTPRVLLELRSRVEEHFARNAYPACRVEPRADLDDQTGEVRIDLTVTPGPRVILGEVHFEGIEKTRESFLRSRLLVKKGEDYDIDRVRGSFRRLYATGLFRTVDIQLAPPEEGRPADNALDEAVRDLTVTVQEAPSREYFIEPGYGSYEGPRVRIGGLERSLFGSGKRGQIESTLGARAQGVTAGLNSPWLFASEFDGNLTLFGNRREEPAFTFQELGVSAGVSRQWAKSFQTTLGYQFRLTELEDVDVTDPEAQEALQDFDVSSLTLTSTWDSRDAYFAPNAGLLASLTLEVAEGALGSDVEFVRALYTQSHFVGLREGTVLALSLRGGIVAPIGDTDVIPLQERMFNGGENTVRSFREDELGLRDSAGNPVGGEAFSVFSAELRQRITGGLSGALFYDVGTLKADYTDIFESGDRSEAVGVGLRYMLPIGPVRLDGAVNPHPGPGEDDFVLHLSVGMAF